MVPCINTDKLGEGQWTQFPSGNIYYRSRQGGLRKVTDQENLRRLSQGTHSVVQGRCEHCGLHADRKFRVFELDGTHTRVCKSRPKADTTPEAKK